MAHCDFLREIPFRAAEELRLANFCELEVRSEGRGRPVFKGACEDVSVVPGVLGAVGC